MTGYLTAAAAAKHACPHARSHGDERARQGCIGGACILWRWKAFSVSDPGYKAAVQRAMTEHGKKHAEAPAFVNAHRAMFDLPTEPTHGWCGLAEEPKG